MMKTHDTFTAARMRAAIYLCGAVICLGLVFSPYGLLVAFLVLALMAYYEGNNAIKAKNAAEDIAEPEPRDRSKETPESW